MTSDSSASPDRLPRVTLAIEDVDLRRQLLDVLKSYGVEVELAASGAAESELQSGESDVVIVSGDELDPADVDAMTGSNSEDAGLAVIGEENATERARFLAAGASQVLGDVDSVRAIGAKIESIAEAEASGGVDGPEVHGSAAQPRLVDFLTRDARMHGFLELVERVVPVDSTLLVTGPTGVGKERLARAIHAEGPRSEGPFISVNCGALAEQLLESELFGHEKGAFTGAEKQRKGHFELATGGILFLDEIGEMPLGLQVKLLTVLQRHEVVRVGNSTPVPVDVRVIAATNRDLRADVQSGSFREDLFFRINVLELEIPALAERRDDIVDLAGRFVSFFRESLGYTDVESISEPAVQALMNYDWPGNVRELSNAIERAMVLGRSRELQIEDLPPAIAEAGGVFVDSANSSAGILPEGWESMTLKEVRERAIARAERLYLEGLLEATGGKIAETAERAGVTPRALYDRMKRVGLDKSDFKD